MLAAGGRFVARGNAAKAYEAGQLLRTVVVEFDSLEKAIAAHDSPGYQAAVALLGGDAAERDFRIVEAAGQSVWHAHIHVIPRYAGDTPNPRGGVRHVIPLKGNY